MKLLNNASLVAPMPFQDGRKHFMTVCASCHGQSGTLMTARRHQLPNIDVAHLRQEAK